MSVENQKLMLDLETATKEQQALMSKVTELIQNDGVILEKLASATDQNNQLQILNSKQKHVSRIYLSVVLVFNLNLFHLPVTK